MALSVEAAELQEHFQWMSEEESRHLPQKRLSAVADEIGDVMIYLLDLAAELGIDPIDAAASKIRKNRRKYPVRLTRGKLSAVTGG